VLDEAPGLLAVAALLDGVPELRAFGGPPVGVGVAVGGTTEAAASVAIWLRSPSIAA